MPTLSRPSQPLVSGRTLSVAEVRSDLQSVNRPVRRGLIVDFEVVNQATKQIKDNLKIQSFQGEKIFCVQMVNSPITQKHDLLNHFLDQDASSIFFGGSPALSLYSIGLTTGLSLEIGEGVAQVGAMIQGALPDSCMAIELAGCDVDRRLECLMKKSGFFFKPNLEEEILRFLKEAHCECLKFENKRSQEYPKIEAILPDGEEIILSEEIILASEILFRENRGLRQQGLQGLIAEVFDSFNIELRSILLDHVNLFGGTSKIPGFTDRLAKELKESLVPHSRLAVSSRNNGKDHSAWIGASIISQLSSLKNQMITKEEYLESGDRIIITKSI